MTVQLSPDIKSYIASLLTQTELSKLAQTCKEWHLICKEVLYSNIYITERVVPLRQTPHKSNNNTNNIYHQLCKWSLVHSNFTKLSQIKELERSLSENNLLPKYIKNILCDDITFILFKLNSWNRRFQIGQTLQGFYFGNVPLNHFLIAFDDLSRFHKSRGLNVTHLQLTSIDQLSGVDSKSMTRLKALSFYLNDFKAIELTDFNSDNINVIKNLFYGIHSLEIISSHNLGLLFLQTINDKFNQPQLFMNCQELSMNHCHGQFKSNNPNQFSFNSNYDSNKEEKLQFNIIKHVFNCGILEKVSFEIDCMYLISPTTDLDMEQCLLEQETNTSYCCCLEGFCQQIAQLPRIKHLKLIKSGDNNSFSFYYFRHLIIELLKNGKFFKDNLIHLSIDTKSSIYPIYELIADERFLRLMMTFKLQNEEIFQIVNNKKNYSSLQRIELLDYYESFHIWEMAIKLSKDDNIMTCNCCKCQIGGKKIIDFLKTNKSIQFYLNPTTIKTFHQYYFELISTILKILRNPIDAKFNGGNRRGEFNLSEVVQGQTFISGGDQYEIMRSILSPEKLEWNNNLSLHTLYKHDSYKELVNYNFVQDLTRTFQRENESNRSFEIECDCKGDELSIFIEFIQHQMNSRNGINGVEVFTNGLG
ncbi:hypothetical protein CAAN3_16S00870 [[Candida] anglica]